MLDSPIVTAATHPQEGACVYLRDIRDGSTTTATVVAWADEEALVRPDGPLAPGAQVALRHVHDGDAGQGRAVVRPSSLPGLLRLELAAPLAHASARGAVRMKTHRGRVRCWTNRRSLDLVALDISLTGCRLASTTGPLILGEHVRLIGEGPVGESPERIHGQVVRVVPRPFGRHEIGIAFDLSRPDARRRIVAWRDVACR